MRPQDALAPVPLTPPMANLAKYNVALICDYPGELGTTESKLIFCNIRSRAVQLRLYCAHRAPPALNLAKYNVVLD